MRGIISWGAYLPYRRLDRTQIKAFVGQGGGRGTRTVASFDEDTSTMGVEAARLALRSHRRHPRHPAVRHRRPRPTPTRPTPPPSTPPCVCPTPPPPSTSARRCARPPARCAWPSRAAGDALVVTADLRTGLAGSADEAAGGDAAAAFVVGEGDGVVAEYLGGASATEEFIDRWRQPGEIRSKVWDDKFSELTYGRLGRQAFKEALAGRRAVSRPTSTRGRGRRAHRPHRQVAGRQARRRSGSLADLTDTVGADRRRPAGRAARLGPRAGRARPGPGAGGARRRRRGLPVPHHRRAGGLHRPPAPSPQQVEAAPRSPTAGSSPGGA